jgi:hypothetical protein
MEYVIQVVSDERVEQEWRTPREGVDAMTKPLIDKLEVGQFVTIRVSEHGE